MESDEPAATQSDGTSSQNVRRDSKSYVGTTVIKETSDTKINLRKDLEARSAFLASFSAEESKAIMRKVDFRFFVLLGLMFMVKNIDYSNASTIKVLQVGQPSNIMNELGMSADEFNWVASIYGISYIIFELPSNMVLKYFSPHTWQSRIFLSWGIATIGCGLAKTSGQLLACRFLVGLFEAGMFPGAVTMLAYWYRTDEFSRPMVWFFGISNLASIVGSLMCYAISWMDGVRGLSAWRWVFIIEGVVTVLLAGVIFWILPDFPKSPRSKSWLSEREQEYLESRLPLNAPTTGDKNFDRKEAWNAFRSPVVWGFLFCQTFMNLNLYGFNWYLPTIITNFGFVSLPNNQLLNIPPTAAGIIAIILSSWFVSRAYIVRPLFVNLIVLGTLVGTIILISTTNGPGRYVACIIGSIFANTYYPAYWSWRAGYLSGSTGAAFAMGLQSSIAQLGAIIGPQVFQAKWASESYRTSFVICMGFVLAGLLANLYTWWLTRKVEVQVLQVRRIALQQRKENRIYDGQDDIDVLGDDTLKNRSLW